MTRNRQRIRASLLALLVVVSVVAGTLAATAGAASTASVQGAIEYGGTIELTLDSATSSGVSAGDVSVWVDGDPRSVSVGEDGTNGRVTLTGLTDVGADRSVVVNVDSSDLDTGNVTVTVTGDVVEAGSQANVFQGGTVAYVASDTGVTFDIYRDGTFLVSRSTGANSMVYVIDTDGQEIGPDYEVRESSGAQVSTTYHLRSLGLTATPNTTDVPGGGSVMVSTTGNGADRPLEFRAVDVASGDTVAIRDVRLSGNGEASATFGDLTSGTYEVVVEDVNTGQTARTEQITVGEAESGDVTLPQKVLTEQRGDVLAIAVAFDGPASGGTAEVTIGNDEVNFEATVSVEDTDNDGRSVVYWDTAASPNATGGVWAPAGGDVTVSSSVAKPVVTGEYPISVSYAGTETAVGTAIVEERATDGVSVLTAPTTASGLDDASAIESTAGETDTVALDRLTLDHDWFVVRIAASGLGGYVDEAGDIDGANGLTVTIEETDASVGSNDQPTTMEARDATLVADRDDDTYYLVTRPLIPRNGEIEPGDQFRVTFTVDGDANAVTDATQEVSTTFSFVNGTASFDDGSLSVPASSGATVSGTSTFAPGTELRVTVRNEGGTSPFLDETDVVVRQDGTWTATFDLSEAAAGDAFTARVSKAGSTRVAAEGEVGAGAGTADPSDDGSDGTATAGEDDTAGPSDDETTAPPSDGDGGDTDDGPTPTTTPAPGFGLAAALAALLVVAVLVRRD